MKIAIGSDHAGFKLKQIILPLLKSMGYEIIDYGTDNPDTSVDYPDYGIKVAKDVSKGVVDRGVLICGTGIGMSMVANKFPNVRGSLCHDLFTAEASRAHNDANILILGERVTNEEMAKGITKVWFQTKFEGGRHENRVNKIKKIDTDN